VTFHYSDCLSAGGVVAADAGGPGFWLARTFATTEPGTVFVPPEARPGWAAACVAVARMADPLRPALAVVDGDIDETTALVIEFVNARGLSVGIEVWSPGGDELAADAHVERLRGLVQPQAGGVATLATDPGQIDYFINAAGPVVAWRPANGSE
jgi:hypothetical protein